MRVALDTNVLLSAMFTRGVCEAVLDVCIASEACIIILSEYILDEFTEYAQKFGASKTDVREGASYLRRNSTIVKPAKLPTRVCSDPDDIAVLGTAVAGEAHVLVTGDADLVRLKRIESIPILAPRVFYERYANGFGAG